MHMKRQALMHLPCFYTTQYLLTCSCLLLPSDCGTGPSVLSKSESRLDTDSTDEDFEASWKETFAERFPELGKLLACYGHSMCFSPYRWMFSGNGR